MEICGGVGGRSFIYALRLSMAKERLELCQVVFAREKLLSLPKQGKFFAKKVPCLKIYMVIQEIKNTVCFLLVTRETNRCNAAT
jgi:hypothetical protein